MSAHEEDATLVARILSGREGSFDRFFDIYYPRLFRFALRRLGGGRAAAKIAQLLQDDGMHEGQQLLSVTKTREALRRTGNPGYSTPSPIERYLHSVWTVRTNTGRCDINVPLMSGYGGNHVMMLPSGLSVVRFMDADDQEVRNTVRAVETYRSSCR